MIALNLKLSGRWRVAVRTSAPAREDLPCWRGKRKRCIFGDDRDALLLRLLRADLCFRQAGRVCAANRGEKTEARRQALYRLPMLCPTWPIPIGFSWHGKVGDDYMNYRLEADEHVGETSVLIVRREGRYTQSAPHEPTGPNGETKMAAVVSQRQGVTLFAWNRGRRVGGRFMDCVR